MYANRINFSEGTAAHLMSISLKVVNMAQVFWASFSLWAILNLIRFIFTWREGEEKSSCKSVPIIMNLHW